jgi:hypothetical protein
MVKLTDEMDRPPRSGVVITQTKGTKGFWAHVGEGIGCLLMGLAVASVIFMLAWTAKGFPAFWK